MRIGVLVSGSVAAYKSVEFVRAVKAAGFEARVVLSRSARELVGPKTLETFSSNPVAPLFDGYRAGEVAEWCDMLVVYAATADLLSRWARGVADEPLVTELLSIGAKPVLVVPAMNPDMWSHAATQANVAKIAEWGPIFIGPVSGRVACGEEGLGRIADEREIIAMIDERFAPNVGVATWRGQRVLVSAGPMRAAVDPVRFIQNRSSGRMGLEIARTARARGARVTLLLGPVDGLMAREAEGSATRLVRYENAADYSAALERLFKDCDVFFSAAAVLDFEPVRAGKKMSRAEASLGGALNLPVTAVPDFVARKAKSRGSRRVISFSLESGGETEIVARAKEKMLAKGVDAVVANSADDPSTGPGSESNRVWLLKPGVAPEAVGPLPKREIAEKILDFLER